MDFKIQVVGRLTDVNNPAGREDIWGLILSSFVKDSGLGINMLFCPQISRKCLFHDL